LLGQNFLAAEFFLVINILLKLQQQILIRFCTFSCNSEYHCFFCEFWRKNFVQPTTGWFESEL